MIRVCPHSDAKCPHGLDCRFSCATDGYDGTKVLLPPQTLGELAKALEASLKAVAERVRAGTPLAGRHEPPAPAPSPLDLANRVGRHDGLTPLERAGLVSVGGSARGITEEQARWALRTSPNREPDA